MDTYQPHANLLKALSHSTRLAILDVLRDGEQCVCHLEDTLDLPQAYVSQQLKILKEAGLLSSRREGLNLYYRIARPQVFRLLDELPALTGVQPRKPQHRHPHATCPCPKCSAEAAETSGKPRRVNYSKGD